VYVVESLTAQVSHHSNQKDDPIGLRPFRRE